MARRENHLLVHQDRLKRLAQSIDALAEKDDLILRRALETAQMRAEAASALHAICADFVFSINRLLTRTEVQLDPPEFNSGAFREHGANLFQINVRGRILQIEFRATPELVSTEDFRIPYTLQGAIRAFNQDLLDKNLIEEQLVFYTVERDARMWRFFDARTYRSGPFGHEYLMALLERLV